MPANFLEQLAAEWYEYQGYYVRRNTKVGLRALGGHDGELDIVAFDPVRKHLVHIEPSTDSLSWAARETKYRKKFAAGRRHIPLLFPGLKLPSEIEQIALLVFASKKNHATLGGGRIVLASEFLLAIVSGIQGKRVASGVVPEHMPLLRTLQFASEYRRQIWLETDK